jgi:hypothetical protein
MMNTRYPVPVRGAALALLALAALVVGGCSKKLSSQLIPNQPPEVRLTGAPAQPDSAHPDFYAYTMQWVGFDPDGRVDHFLYAVDPADPSHADPSDTTWHTTTKNEQTFFFSAGRPIVPIDPQNTKSEAPHIFAIYAVDNEGAISRRGAVRGFFSYTQAPIVTITDPVANAGFSPSVTPTVTFRWTGTDPDGQFTTKPVRWKLRLFGQKNADPGFVNFPDFIAYALSPAGRDSVRRYYAPDFPGWITVGAETTFYQFRNLNPQSTYLFIVTGFDEAGAYDPIFSPDRNMLKFSVTFAGTFGPVITMFNQFFFYQYPTGGFDLSESRVFHLEIPSDQKVTFNWFASPPPGADIRRTRWVMDLLDLTDETPRTDETRDPFHWSTWSANTVQATVGPFPPVPGAPPDPNAHRFYIEAEDTNGLVSIGIIEFRAIRSSFQKELLLVDDTRFRPDYKQSNNSPTVDPPVGPWPTAAELDTFLFAVGGKPWNSYPGWPTTPTPSPIGIFQGYPFDTLGTRGISATGVVPLSTLGQYRHVIWYTDPVSAAYNTAPNDPAAPRSGLRIITSPGQPVVLSTYITQGGKVWVCGGGAAFATLIAWNKANTRTDQYTARDGELIPGRFMYDFAHWQEGVAAGAGSSFWATKFGSSNFGVGPRPGRGWPGQPDYSLLPNRLHLKAGGEGKPADPPPPLRTASSDWFQNGYAVEYITLPTFIREDYDPDPDRVLEYSTLDTLYLGFTGGADNKPNMTYYHGLETQPVVFSGFNIWSWRRDECIQLIDFVLQQIWGIQRTPVSREPNLAPASARRAAP